MGACPKCGKPRVKKNKFGVRRCARCGIVNLRALIRGTDDQMILSGVADAPPAFACDAPPPDSGRRLRVVWRSDAALTGDGAGI